MYLLGCVQAPSRPPSLSPLNPNTLCKIRRCARSLRVALAILLGCAAFDLVACAVLLGFVWVEHRRMRREAAERETAEEQTDRRAHGTQVADRQPRHTQDA